MTNTLKFILILLTLGFGCKNKNDIQDKSVKINIESIPGKLYTKQDTIIIHTGSCFYVHYKSKSFIVTARHNIIDSNNNLIANVAHVETWYNYPNYIYWSYCLDNNLQIKNTKPVKKIIEDIYLDLAILYIGDYVPNNHIFSFDLEKETKNLDSLNCMDEIILVGYPFSLIDQSNYNIFRPIIRKGIISNIDTSSKSFISDILSTYGDSGSPVIFASNNSICGILIQSINKSSGLGFSVIASIDAVTEKINKSYNLNEFDK